MRGLPFEPHAPDDPIATIRQGDNGIWLDSRGFTFALDRSYNPADCTDSECYEPTEVPHSTYFFRCLTDAGFIHVDHFRIDL